MKKKIINQILENLNVTTVQVDQIEKNRQAEIAKIVEEIKFTGKKTGKFVCMLFLKEDPDLATHIMAAPLAGRKLLITSWHREKVQKVYEKYTDLDYRKMGVDFCALKEQPDVQNLIDNLIIGKINKDLIYLVFKKQ
jgi:hypothetical protein